MRMLTNIRELFNDIIRVQIKIIRGHCSRRKIMMETKVHTSFSR